MINKILDYIYQKIGKYAGMLNVWCWHKRVKILFKDRDKRVKLRRKNG
jgi:hypothetical protein